ncbi:hypothetical protein MAR_014503 [Mya arenaria]|uniref:Uncharacterized protein n=1 Tax=Mya arenaria TaxID=6604 RepID=A0ABY7G5L2_MYAAR|nr:hypothetical protein MAR_014503 [Mya arenaria]
MSRWLSGFLTRSKYVLDVTSVQLGMTEDDTKQRYIDMKKHVQDLQASQQLIGILERRLTEIEQFIKNLPSLCNDFADRHDDLDIFYINNIMKFDYDITEFDWRIFVIRTWYDTTALLSFAKILIQVSSGYGDGAVDILGIDFHGDAMEVLKKRQGNPKGGWRPSFSKANTPPEDIVEILQKM